MRPAELFPNVRYHKSHEVRHPALCPFSAAQPHPIPGKGKIPHGYRYLAQQRQSVAHRSVSKVWLPQSDLSWLYNLA